MMPKRALNLPLPAAFDMLSRNLFKLKLSWRALRAKHPGLRDYYITQQKLLNLELNQAPLLAIDLEMTGLDPRRDQIVSIGVVPIQHGRLILAKAEHKLINISGSVGQSASIHGILDKHLDEAVTLQQAMAWFSDKIQGQILVAHHSPLDLAFLQRGLSGYYQQEVKLIAIDTLAIEQRRLLRQQAVFKQGMLRLGAARQRYGLPTYTAHNALIDAIACGELLLAQTSSMCQGDRVYIAELLS